MRLGLQRAASHIADCDRYRLLPVYAFLLVLMVRVFSLLPSTPQNAWYRIYLGFWVWELQNLAQYGALILAVCLATVGIFRRAFLAKFFSIAALMLAVNALLAVDINWFYPFAIAWRSFTFWSFDMPIGYLQAKASSNYVNLGSVYMFYAMLLWLLARPFYRRLSRKLGEAGRRMGWQFSSLL